MFKSDSAKRKIGASKKILTERPALLSIMNVSKSFEVGEQKVNVLKDISFSVRERDFLIIFGPSGCGKSTLLHTLLGLETPSSGKVVFMGRDLYKNTSEDDRTEIRKKHFGMVYQQSNWLKALTVIENVALPMILNGAGRIESFQKAEKMLKAVHMDQWADYRPSELSSGQQQRVSVARALIGDPEIIIADEPTGNLDFEAGRDMVHLLGDLNHIGKTIIMVTHDLEYLKSAKIIIEMLDGSIVGTYDEKDRERLLDNSLGYKKALMKNNKALVKNRNKQYVQQK